MRVAVYRSNADLRIEERTCPEPGPGELLLRIEASGICGSDTMEWYRRPKAPLVLGHEVAGVVEAAGAGTPFTAGDRVVATHHVPCGSCRYCLTDRESACDTLHRTSFDPGGFAEFVRVPALHVARGGVLRLPPEVSFEEGSFVEPLACVVRAQRLAGVLPDAAVAVLGAGVSGLLHVQLAKAQGARCVVASDVSPQRVEAARAFGADTALHAEREADLATALRGANDGRLAERVFVCTGARSAFEQALRLVDRGGAIVFFAPLPPGESLALPVADLWRLGVTLTHSYAGPPAEMRSALDLIATRRVDVARMITDRVPLAEIGEGFRRFVSGEALKVIVEPQR